MYVAKENDKEFDNESISASKGCSLPQTSYKDLLLDSSPDLMGLTL